ncbi:MAG: tRNA lysidine(34) synthetase TilS, partial [Thermomicrobiales bacterium]
LHAVAAVARQTGRRVTAGHVRHGARLDDMHDADAVRATASRLSVECRVVSLRDGYAEQRHAPSEATMREARYRALADLADELSAEAVLTGHTLDDQAETVLLHLMRGAGIDGLSGMAEETLLPIGRDTPDERERRPLRVLRPLLAVRRRDTMAYCVTHGLTIVSDPTNDDVRYTRNWVRLTILPLLRERNPDITAVLARAATTIRDDAAFLADETMRALARCHCQREQFRVHFSQSAFASEHIAIQRRILRDGIQRITGIVPRADDVDAMRRYTATSRSSALRHFGGIACCLAFGQIILGRDDAVTGWVQAVASLRYPLSRDEHVVGDDMKLRFALSDPSVAAYDFRIVPASLRETGDVRKETVMVPLRLPDRHAAVIRNRAPADRFWMRGSARQMLLRDYLSARTVPAPVRDLLPLLVVNDTIAWVIGHDVGATFAATEATATHIGILTRLTGYGNERIGEG